MRNDQSLVDLWLVIYFLKNYLDFLEANPQVPFHIHFLHYYRRLMKLVGILSQYVTILPTMFEWTVLNDRWRPVWHLWIELVLAESWLAVPVSPRTLRKKGLLRTHWPIRQPTGTKYPLRAHCLLIYGSRRNGNLKK